MPTSAGNGVGASLCHSRFAVSLLLLMVSKDDAMRD
jgi:hypothetical protein